MHYTMFSIIISTHLRPSLLKRALESIKFQHSPHQIIVVSDVFCTETYEVCNNILTSTDCLIIAKNIKGPSESRNLGIPLIKYSHSIFLDDDDYFGLNFFEDIVSNVNFRNRPDRLYFTNFSIVSELDVLRKFFLHERCVDDLEVKNFIPNNCIIYPSRIIKDLRFNDIQYEDWDFLLQATQIARPIHLEIFGPIIDKSYNSTISRGEQNATLKLIECYQYIYKKFPPSNKMIAEARKDLFKAIGIDLN